MSRKVIQGLFLGGQPRMLAQVAQANGPPRPPAARAQGAGDAFRVDPGQLGLANGGGQPLPDAVRSKMEAALGADFSTVRVHVGPQAQRIGALAFTMGTDIYFAPGRYQPDTVRGQQLLGHELTHVVQQRAGRVRGPMGAMGTGVAVVQDRALEAEAEWLGRRAAAHPIVAQLKVRPGTSSQTLVGQRRSIVNWHGTAYQPNEVIQNVHYDRRGSAGGNHFISDNWVNSIIIDIIHGLTRANALPILHGLTVSCIPPGIDPNPNPVQTQRGFDDFLDDCIHRISNAHDNRFHGRGYGDSGGEGIDKPYSTADRNMVKGYGRTFVTAMRGGYQTAGRQPSQDTEKFLRMLNTYANT